MGTRELPKEYYNKEGISVTVIGNTEKARELFPEAKKLMFELNLENTAKLPQYWKMMELSDGGYVQVNTIHGKQSAYIFVPPKKGVSKKVSEKEKTLRYPVVAYELQNAPDFKGYYVCSNLGWMDMFTLIQPDLDRPYGIYEYEDINPDGDLNQIPEKVFYINRPDLQKKTEIYELPDIGTYDLDDDEYYYEYSGSGGEFNPSYCEHWPFWAFLSDLGGNSCAVSLGNCFEEYAEGPPYSGIYGAPGGVFVSAHSTCLDRVTIYCSGCIDSVWGDVWEFGKTITYNFQRTLSWIGTITLADVFQFGYGGETVDAEDSIAENYGCSSSTIFTESNTGTMAFCQASGIVRGVDNYEDDTVYIVLYEVTTYDYYESRSTSPWCQVPYANDYPEMPDEYFTIHYWARVVTPDYDLLFEFADFQRELNEDEFVSVFECGIYDFHGEPVFVFSWLDERIGEHGGVKYCSVFQGKIRMSDFFLVIEEVVIRYYHPINESDRKFDGYGAGYSRAVGVAVTEKEIQEL